MIRIVDTLIKKKVPLIAIKEGISLDGHQDMRTKVMIALFGLFAEVEQDVISGRPKGSLGKSKLDGKEDEIRILLQKEVSKASIAKIFGISRTALYSFIESRRLKSAA